MKIKDIMSKKLVYCSSDDNILFASNLMKVNDVGFILIFDDKKLYGVVTDRDIACSLMKENMPIKEIACTDIISIDSDKDILDALDVMRSHKIKRLVVSSDNKVKGVISLSDIYNSDVSSDKIVKTLKSIYAINRNDEDFDVDVSDFLL